jgi:hypothetical protein
MLKTFRCAITIVTAVFVTVAPSLAGQATFISGVAANKALSTYRDLAAQQAVPPLTTARRNVSVTVEESTEEFSITFHGLETSGRSSLADSRGVASASRSTSDKAYFMDLAAGSKTLGAIQTSALLAAMALAESKPVQSASVRQYAEAGNYLAEVFEPGDRYIFISMSYPGSTALGKTAIGCNPQREFRFDTVSETVTELKGPCF